MAIDPLVLAEANLLLQIVLIVSVSVAVILAKRKQFAHHCNLQRINVIIQILAIVGIMLPSLWLYLEYSIRLPFVNEMIIHHSLGIALVVVWAYINLGFKGILKLPKNVVWLMRGTLALWIVAIILGLHIFYILHA